MLDRSTLYYVRYRQTFLKLYLEIRNDIMNEASLIILYIHLLSFCLFFFKKGYIPLYLMSSNSEIIAHFLLEKLLHEGPFLTGVFILGRPNLGATTGCLLRAPYTLIHVTMSSSPRFYSANCIVYMR